MATAPRPQPDDFFLSADNPTANADQQNLEALALRIFQMPLVQNAKAQAGQRWKTIVGRDMTAEALSRFDELAEEYAFCYVLRAVNSDPNRPKVLGHLYGPPHEWFGMQVPGSRGSGGDGPDGHYSIIPIDGYARYVIEARRFDPAPADVVFTLVGNLSMTMTLGSLDWQDVHFAPDGRFVITLDPAPADGRPNHIQTALEARFLFIRDCRADWRQVPCAYRVRRLDPPSASPMTIEQMAARAARWMVDDVPALYWFIRTLAALDANTVPPPINAGAIGGVVSQRLSFARLDLAEDEAFVFTFGSGDAPFRDLVLHDSWFRTIDYWKRTSSMNNAQAVPNADGSTTYVASARDPGVHNWLDTGGLRHLLVLHRWQGLRRDAGPDRQPWAKGQLVKLAGLEAVLPKDMQRITPEDRRRQLAERLATFKLRYVDR